MPILVLALALVLALVPIVGLRLYDLRSRVPRGAAMTTATAATAAATVSLVLVLVLALTATPTIVAVVPLFPREKLPQGPKLELRHLVCRFPAAPGINCGVMCVAVPYVVTLS